MCTGAGTGYVLGRWGNGSRWMLRNLTSRTVQPAIPVPVQVWNNRGDTLSLLLIVLWPLTLEFDRPTCVFLEFKNNTQCDMEIIKNYTTSRHNMSLSDSLNSICHFALQVHSGSRGHFGKTSDMGPLTSHYFFALTLINSGLFCSPVMRSTTW